MSIFKTYPDAPAFAQEHAALLKSADPIVRAMRDPAGRAEIPAKCEKPKFGLVPAESLCSSFPTFEAPLPINDTVGGRPCERSQKTEETALKSDALGTGSNLHIWPFLGAEAGSEQTHPTVTNQFYLERGRVSNPGLDALEFVDGGDFSPAHGPSTELGSTGYPAESLWYADRDGRGAHRLFPVPCTK
jgi:hypothetical protein